MGTLRLRFPRAVLLTLLCACGDSSGGGGSTDFGPDGPFVPEPETAVPDAPGTGRTFYVSSSGGSDSNNGMSEATAFASVSAVNALSLLPGDKVLFKCGDTFRGQPLVLLSSGSDVDYIQIGSYPSGCANRPRLWGSQPISGWTGRPEAAASAATTSAGAAAVGAISASGAWTSTTRAGRRRAIRATSACTSGSEPGAAPGDERFVRYGRRRTVAPGG